jgi:hypothetical protein
MTELVANVIRMQLECLWHVIRLGRRWVLKVGQRVEEK